MKARCTGIMVLSAEQGRAFDLGLRGMAFRAVLKSLTLSQLKAALRPIGDQSPMLPPLLVPELMPWALNCDAPSRVVLALLKAWPYKDIHFLRTLHLAFESIPGHQDNRNHC